MFSRIAKAWDRFFFVPISPATIALFRIAFGLVVLDALVGKYPDRVLFYGEQGLVSSSTAEKYFRELPGFLHLHELVPSGDPWLACFFVILIAATVLFTCGLFTRTANAVLFVGLVALSNRDLFADNSGDDLMRINLFFLLFSPAGAAYSLDRWRALRRGQVHARAFAPWAQRLLQLQLSFVYFDSVFLRAQGPAWLDGTAIYYALNYQELMRFNLNGWVTNLWEIKIATWSALFVELAMATLVWIRRFRYGVLILALGFHLGINWAMQFPIFEYVMIASLIVFIEPEDVEMAVQRLSTKPPFSSLVNFARLRG